MPIMNNIAAVYFEQGKYDECIEQCNKTIEYSKEHAHSYEDVAKVFAFLCSSFPPSPIADSAMPTTRRTTGRRLLRTMRTVRWSFPSTISSRKSDRQST